jgi:hypothetical protein
MKIQSFLQTLAAMSELRWALPDGSLVPAHAHVTEVALMTRRFVDCGGTHRMERRIQLQLWVANDVDLPNSSALFVKQKPGWNGITTKWRSNTRGRPSKGTVWKSWRAFLLCSPCKPIAWPRIAVGCPCWRKPRTQRAPLKRPFPNQSPRRPLWVVASRVAVVAKTPSFLENSFQ